MRSAEPYLIWSNEHRAWWGAERRGYYRGIASAGRYSRAEALTIARSARGGWQSGDVPPEIAIPERDAHFMAVAASPDWQRGDAPAVRPADGERTCASCSSWSPWMGETGDCLFHAYRRREAIITAMDAAQLAQAREDWPSKSARTTSADEACDGWKAIGER